MTQLSNQWEGSTILGEKKKQTTKLEVTSQRVFHRQFHTLTTPSVFCVITYAPISIDNDGDAQNQNTIRQVQTKQKNSVSFQVGKDNTYQSHFKSCLCRALDGIWPTNPHKKETKVV